MAKASTSKPGDGARRTAHNGGRASDHLTRDERLEILRWMLLTRKLEERLVNLYRQNQVVGGLYRSLGQEAETIGAVYALEKEDVIAPLIRNMGAVLVKGYRPRDVAMQYMARADGPSRGKDLNIHFGEVPEPGVVSPISMLGVLIPVMTGIALAFKLRRQPQVALAFIGDGGSSTGPFYEGMNLAAVWKLPLIVIVENNGYAYSTPMHKQMAVERIAEKAPGLGIFGTTVDGNDALDVYDAVRSARERAIRGEGPSLIEVITYRRKGHAEHDAQKYVPAGEVETWEKKDPVDRYEKALIEAGHATAESIEAMTKEVVAHLEEEFDAAFASPLPEPEVALENVYASPQRAEDVLLPYRRRS
ncbi:MAG TPA: thiamine pyrophosphate-dependent dehydrogenase E1 component subunit alpha [Dongiaceae bacterium]|jgi:pyruvate dehydrogenase E1 component alpha subunit/2-oxoisovalerate dehydrogenase E1 component alpha subunit|nr:thiamine pyrophosphate-dependent dehydrogenase E1 component subunit alpha [Dongiaceae bacterium]